MTILGWNSYNIFNTSYSTGIICRTEIVQTLAAHMWVYTSKYAYNTICSKLVKVHPTLSDDACDDQVPHVSMLNIQNYNLSIIALMETKIERFLRRPSNGASPPLKKWKTGCSVRAEDKIDDDDYDDEKFEKDVKVRSMIQVFCLV